MDIVGNFRRLSHYVDDRAREFLERQSGLSKLERRLDFAVLGLFIMSAGLDYAVTKIYCQDPSWEANEFTRWLMNAWGKDIGLGLVALSLFIGLLVFSYCLYKTSTWYLKRGHLDFPILRRLAPYTFLIVVATKHTFGALSWFLQ